jgi:hypothetical protein
MHYDYVLILWRSQLLILGQNFESQNNAGEKIFHLTENRV